MITDERKGHWQLYCTLVRKQDRPCAKCGSRLERELHRLSLGGAYVKKNVQVLCFECHKSAHYHGKFAVGDKVSLNGRTPAYIPLERYRPRTVKAVEYNPEKQCNLYLLGANAKGACAGEIPSDGYTAYLFRSYQLIGWNSTGKLGRPREKRRYRRRGCPDMVSGLSAETSAGTRLSDTN